MKRFNLKHLFLVLVALFSIVGAEAKSYRVRDVENVQRVDARRFVTNPDGILSREAVATLDSICYALKASGVAEVAIVALDDIRPQDMVRFSQELFEGWGVGDDELDNGLGILLVGDMREIRFHTGYGLEGALPDALCYRIQQEYMVPYFRAGDYSAGMVAGMRAVDKVLSGEELPRAEQDDDMSAILFALIFMAVMIILPMTLFLMHERQQIKCPQCGKYTLRVVNKQRVTINSSITRVTTILRCDNCHSEHTRTENHNHHDNGGRGGGIWVMPMGGFGGGRSGFGGGGFGGGGFGGGSFGGGGSGSGW